MDLISIDGRYLTAARERHGDRQDRFERETERNPLSTHLETQNPSSGTSIPNRNCRVAGT